MLHSFSYVIPAVHKVLETKLVSYNYMSSLVLYMFGYTNIVIIM